MRSSTARHPLENKHCLIPYGAIWPQLKRTKRICVEWYGSNAYPISKFWPPKAKSIFCFFLLGQQTSLVHPLWSGPTNGPCLNQTTILMLDTFVKHVPFEQFDIKINSVSAISKYGFTANGVKSGTAYFSGILGSTRKVQKGRNQRKPKTRRRISR